MKRGFTKLKESTRQRKMDELAAKLLGKTVQEIQAMRGDDDSKEKQREAQAVLLFLEQPDQFIIKECDQCGGSFMTSYKYVTLCSHRCRVKSLRKMGIEWNPTRTAEERWHRAQIPIEYIIPPQALAVLLKLATDQQQKNDSQISQEPEPLSAS